MSLTIQLTPEMEARLRERAAAEGKDPAEFAVEAVVQRLTAPDASSLSPTAARRLDALNSFVAGMREHAKTLPPGHIVDDSRESIYEGRGE
jgi:hypothetical protein